MTTTSPEGAPSFDDLALRPELLAAVKSEGYEQPTPIQASAIPPLVAGKDVLGQARTGTGKTAAFSLPLLQRLDTDLARVQAIVLTPTRELAIQVAGAVKTYGKNLGRRGVNVLAVYGGQPINVQLKALRRGVHVVIGTPGRVKDHLERGTLDLSGVRFFGLDEADEMLKMGFIDDVVEILEHAPTERQIAVFSATLPAPIRAIAERYQHDPVDVSIKRPTLTVPKIEQFSLPVRGIREKDEAVERILSSEEHDAVLIFAGTRQACDDLTERLQGRGLEVESVHGGMSQVQREAVVRRLRAKRTRVVVATDVAARGLDVDHIGLVINYDLPRDREVYVHRIGRTGRAGREGRSISFYRSRERHLLRTIERVCGGQPMQRLRLPSDRELAAKRRALLAEEIKKIIPNLDPGFLQLVRELEAEGLEPAQIAAAATRLAWGSEPLEPKEQPRHRERHDRPERHERNEHRSRPQPKDPGHLSGEEIELVLPVGSLNRLRPGDVVGCIANETGLPGKVVGNIRILERVCFVAVAAEHSDAILAALTGINLRNRQLQPRLAHPEQGRATAETVGDDRGDRHTKRPRKPHHRGRGPRSSSEEYHGRPKKNRHAKRS